MERPGKKCIKRKHMFLPTLGYWPPLEICGISYGWINNLIKPTSFYSDREKETIYFIFTCVTQCNNCIKFSFIVHSVIVSLNKIDFARNLSE